jgi:hypothetical protein
MAYFEQVTPDFVDWSYMTPVDTELEQLRLEKAQLERDFEVAKLKLEVAELRAKLEALR